MTTEAAATAIRVRLAELRWTHITLGHVADIDPVTVRRLMNGTHAPQQRTRARIERALGWTPDTIGALLAGEPLPTPDRSALDEHLAVIFRLHSAVTPRERARVLLDLALEQAAPE